MRLDLFVPYRKNPSALRRLLFRIAPTWVSSPLRRIVQATCFALFLILFFYVCWPYGSPEYAQSMRQRQFIPAPTFLWLDPLVSISTAIAARMWVWALFCAGAILFICIFIPRGFCGYVCPLGTLIDLFDYTLGRGTRRWHLKRDGWWVNLKYYILAGVLTASLAGGMLAGFFAAIAVITRGLMFTLAPVQRGSISGWYLVPAMNWGQHLSIALFALVLGLGWLRPRFWCRYVCPTGAVLSLGNLFRINQRRVSADCIDCDKCRRICPFDAIAPDFTTRTSDCTLCETCGGVCPTSAIAFGPRWQRDSSKPSDASSPAISRRGWLSGALCGAAAGGIIAQLFARIAQGKPVVRPPGSLPEMDFPRLCIRCGECFKVCPNDVLQPVGLELGPDGLWTPKVVANWSGCEPRCNNCGQVCPTGAIRPLSLDEKRAARMGLAIVDTQTCLPFAQIEACRMCYDECEKAGYQAISFQRIGTKADANGNPVEGSGFLSPIVDADKCIGCGLCQTRCYVINVKQRKILARSAIIIEAGEGKDDRVRTGSYIRLRELRLKSAAPPTTHPSDDYLPSFI